MSKKNKKNPAVKETAPVSKAKTPATGENNKYHFWLIVGFAALLYLVTTGFGFVLDDDIVTKKNAFVQKGFGGIWDIFTHGYLYGFNGMNDQSYRPLTLAFMAVEKGLFGENAGVFHFFNVVYFSLATGIFYVFLKNVMGPKSIVPLVASLFFAAHPIHTEVVANIKGRDEILGFLFGILSLQYLLKFHAAPQTKKYLYISLLCLLCSALAKETGLAFLGLVPLTLWFFTSADRGYILRLSGIFMAPVALYFLMRYSAMDNMFFTGGINDVINNSLSGATNPSQWLGTRIYILGKYLWLLFFPINLSYDYSYNQVPLTALTDFKFIVSALIYLAILVLFIWGTLRKKAFAFGIGIYLIMLTLVSNFLTPVGATMAERFLFSSSAGFCLLLALCVPVVLNYVKGIKQWYYLVIPILALYAFKTYNRSLVWQDQETLLRSGLESAPNSARVYNHYATFFREKAENTTDQVVKKESYDSAVSLYQYSLKIYPRYSEATYNLGVIYLATGKLDEAKKEFEKTISINPGYEGAMNNLGVIAVNQNRVPEAIEQWKKALKTNPKNVQVLQNLGAIYFNQNNIDSALLFTERAYAVKPEDAKTIESLYKMYTAKGNKQKADEMKSKLLPPEN